MKKANLILAAALGFTSLLGFNANAQEKPGQYMVNGVAIAGYDAVAYFASQKAVKGDSAIRFSWNGATWYFSNTENRRLFEAEPQKYAPQYGGYCAYGASNGYKAKTDPEAFTIVGQKLYLNYNRQVKATWLPDTTARINAADKYWKSLTDQQKHN